MKPAFKMTIYATYSYVLHVPVFWPNVLLILNTSHVAESITRIKSLLAESPSQLLLLIRQF